MESMETLEPMETMEEASQEFMSSELESQDFPERDFREDGLDLSSDDDAPPESGAKAFGDYLTGTGLSEVSDNDE